MRRFLCYLRNRLERLATLSLRKKFVLIGFLTIPLSLLSICNTFASSDQPITYWVSQGLYGHQDSSWDWNSDIRPNNIISPVANANNTIRLTFIRAWFSSFGESLVSKTAANVTLSLAIWPNGNNDFLWSCGSILESASLTDTNDNTISQVSDIHCLDYRDSPGGDPTFRLIATFAMRPKYGNTWSQNSPYYLTFNSNSPIFLIKSNEATDGSALYLSPNVTIEGIQTYTDENSANINEVTDILRQQQEQDQKDREDFQNQVDSSEQSAEDLADDVSNASSSLLTIIGNFVNIVLNPPQSDCRITLDVGNANFGQADLCRLSLPQPLAVIGSLFVIAMIITIAVSLIITFLNLLKGATQG